MRANERRAREEKERRIREESERTEKRERERAYAARYWRTL